MWDRQHSLAVLELRQPSPRCTLSENGAHGLPSLKQKQACLHTANTPHGDINGTVNSPSLSELEASTAHEVRMHTRRHSNEQGQQGTPAATEAVGQLTFSPSTESKCCGEGAGISLGWTAHGLHL